MKVAVELLNEIIPETSVKLTIGKKLELKLKKKTPGMNWMGLEKGGR